MRTLTIRDLKKEDRDRQEQRDPHKTRNTRSNGGRHLAQGLRPLGRGSKFPAHPHRGAPMSKAPGEILQTYSSHKATSDDESQPTDVARPPPPRKGRWTRHPSGSHGSEESRFTPRQHGKHSEQHNYGIAKIARTQDQYISKELFGETNTPSQVDDWHSGTSGSDNTENIISDRPRGKPRPPRRDGADPIDREPRPTFVRQTHPRPRNPADGGSSPV